ncbi:hypothetical protein AOQ84DRAFT_286233 [Glonium stellatum]|uniref:Integral membrane protein n=1 Tax=Glonium stellatum TaxID=574774 RepID=A0A8E2JW83_9PEZI|nr:hypothetical protein AOQ84DRAFT_286233 [Glonium stellatum]
MDSEDNSSVNSAQRVSEKENQEDVIKSPQLALASECFTFIKRGARYVPATRWKLQNNLLVGVGFLELANAGDFAANVFNDVPVPPYAVALMVLGGILALSLSCFAFQDFRLGCSNMLLLREERQRLRKSKAVCSVDEHINKDLDTRLSVNFREMGTEIISRILMDTFMGFGAIVIGIGTFMAIGGANRRVWYASNLLSGYIGNVPLALYAVINASWCFYVRTKAHQHGKAGSEALHGQLAEALLRRRVHTVEIYATVNGITSLLGGAGSLIAATKWWGYVILAVVIISSISCNYVWRHRVGYERPVRGDVIGMTKDSLLKELEFIVSAQKIIQETPSKPLLGLVADSQSIMAVIEFIVDNDLFEDFCDRLLRDSRVSTSLVAVLDGGLTINSSHLLAIDKHYNPYFLEVAQACVGETGRTLFKYRERYLLEMLGSYLCITKSKSLRTVVDARAEA